jgi:hypothetical protein
VTRWPAWDRRGESEALAPGEYQVRVDANGVPVVGPVTTSPDVFAVVAP